MTNREQVIKNAIGEYRAAVASKSVGAREVARAINMMYNVYIMLAVWNVKGTEELRQTIIEAENRLTEMENFA